MPKKEQDIVFVRELFVKALTGVDAWHRPQPQPVSISIWLPTNVSRAGETDHLVYSLNYDVISRKVTRLVETSKFRTLEDIAEKVAHEVLKDSSPGQFGRFQVRKPRALLRAGSVDIDITRKNDEGGRVYRVEDTTDTIRIHKLELVTIIGVNTIERMHRQNIVIDLTLHKPKNGNNNRDAGEFNEKYDFREIVEAVSNHVESSKYKTVEAFVVSVAQVACQFGVEKVTVRAEKPSAITFADAAGVEVTRTKEYFEKHKNVAINGVETNQNYIHSGSVTPATSTTASTTRGNSPEPQETSALFPTSGEVGTTDPNATHKVYLAFGSNVGNTVENVESALDILSKKPGISRIVQTSGLYESDPMYLRDQEKFLNGVVEIETTLKPLDLLDTVKQVEYEDLGRVKEVENGPRSIDLDILLYDDLVMNDPKLNIPHINMLSRSFVLQPLIDIVSPAAVHPLTAEPYQNHLDQIPKESQDQKSSQLCTIVPLTQGRKLCLDPVHNSRHTEVMGILNATPDSFSDGGRLNTVQQIVDDALAKVSDGATILDIGGVSTRPGSTDPGASEEHERVVPAIKALRDCDELKHIPISVDTYRASVARAAIEAGADIINDITGGQMDEDMFNTARDLRVPIILNHTRGTPDTMNSLADYRVEQKNYTDNSDEAVIEVVGQELEGRVNEAIAAGLHRWQIILDPGIGFAKNQSHNLAIIRHFSKLKARESFAGLAWLLGTSRKKFIGKITGQKVASERILGTAATVTALIGEGADIVRVHDVKEISQAAKVSDAIYRNL